MTVEADKNKIGRVGQQVRDSGRASVASPKSVCWPVFRSIQAFNWLDEAYPHYEGQSALPNAQQFKCKHPQNVNSL